MKSEIFSRPERKQIILINYTTYSTFDICSYERKGKTRVAGGKMQVSLAIRRGYVPDKSQTSNTKTGKLDLNKANLNEKWQFSLVICSFLFRE